MSPLTKQNFAQFFRCSSAVILAITVAGCGGSQETGVSVDQTEQASQPQAVNEIQEPAPAPASTEPTMANMQGALMDAIKEISADTVSELTNMAKAEEAIEVPDSFEKVESVLESAGQSDLIKGFSSSLNTSALDALGDYKEVLSSTIDSLRLPDVEAIAKGGDDSLTRYVESTAGSTLKNSLIPLVKEAAANSGAQEWIDKIKDAIPQDTEGLLGQVSAVTGVKLPTNFDVEGYLTDELMGKFFNVMAQQEKLFRQDPQGRSADLFEKVMEMAN